MDFDDKEVFETFENEFQRKENTKRPGNRFPSWLIPLVIVFVGVIYFGTQLDRFRPTAPTETPTVDPAVFLSEEPFSAVPVETGTAESTSAASNPSAVSEGVIIEMTSAPTAIPTDSPSFFERFTRLFAGSATETPDVVETQPETDPNANESSADPQSVPSGSNEPTISQTGPESPLPPLPTIGSQVRSEAETAAAETTEGTAGAAGQPTTSQVSNDSDGVVVLRAPSATPLAAGTVAEPLSLSDPFTDPKPTITIEIPLPSATAEIKAALADPAQPETVGQAAGDSAPLTGEADDLSGEAETAQLSEPALTAEATEEPGFFERVGAFFFGAGATATTEPPLPTEIFVNPDGSETVLISTATPMPETTDEPGFFQRVGGFFFGTAPTSTPEPQLPTEIFVNPDGSETILISTATATPQATEEPSLFQRIGWFFFGAPTEVPTVEPAAEVNLPEPEQIEATPESVPDAVSSGGGGPKQAGGTGANSDLDDEPMQFPSGQDEPFYLPTSDIENPPTLIPQGFQLPQPTRTSAIGLPLITQIAPTQPFSNLPTVRPTQIQPFNPTQPPLNLPILRITPNSDPGIYQDPGLPSQQQNPAQQPHLLPTALPNTGFGDQAELPRKVIAFIGLIALIIVIRVIRRRGQNVQK